MTGVIQLTADEHDDLGRLVRAGDDGIWLGRDFKLSVAIRLEMAGFAKLHDQRSGMRATATGAGKTFHRRSCQ